MVIDVKISSKGLGLDPNWSQESQLRRTVPASVEAGAQSLADRHGPNVIKLFVPVIY
jgi:hypothetical protein